MLTSQYLLSTLKETPYDAKIISHQLMIRSGMIKKTASGLYIWLPTGIRILKKIEKIIRKEMEKINALEISMPIIQSEYLWEESGRLNTYGEELLKFFDRRKQKFILGPTNEEIVSHFISPEIRSYKNLPLIIYQIQTKCRDEIRPRFGVIRAREFLMKDAYSFHINQDCLEQTYNIFYNSYINIFKKIQLKFHIVKADSGSMGGEISHEFQAFSENGEDEIVFSDSGLYASNMNTAQSMETINFLKKNQNLKFISEEKKNKKSIVTSDILNIPIKNKIQTFLVKTKINHNNSSIAALLIRGDHELNLFKVEQIEILKKPLIFLDDEEIIKLIGVKKKFLGPIGLNIPIIADISTLQMKNFTIGANIKNHFFINVNWNTDLKIPNIQDIRKVTKDDLSPDGKGNLNIKKSIEIGHIFQIGKKYSKIMKKFIKNKNSIKKNFYMGCYGIGITRIIAALIEQNHDNNGIIWPDIISPFEVALIPIDMYKSIKVQKIANILYDEFKKIGLDVILDDRNERPGIMFNEIDLIGIPHQIIISTRSLSENNVEYRERKNKTSILVGVKEIKNFLLKKFKNKNNM